METLIKAEIKYPHLKWFNTSKQIESKDLEGKLCIFHFWTGSCVHCLHTMKILKDMQAKYPDEVLVIGVHSPKFDYEKNPEAAKNLVIKNKINYPVLHDPEKETWDQYFINAWPSLLIFDPDRKVLGKIIGEPKAYGLTEFIDKAIFEYKKKRKLDKGASKLIRPEYLKAEEREASSILRYPSRIDYCKETKRFAISDSGNNQILILDQYGKAQERIKANFDKPQGIRIKKDRVFVADTGNHVLKKVFLDQEPGQRLSKTIAGTGRQGHTISSPNESVERSALNIRLSSPWDIEILDEKIFFANAGSHQIGLVNKQTFINNYAGTSQASLVDGPKEVAALSKPIALRLSDDKKKLFFLDSETGALRFLNLISGDIESYTGIEALFFGDRDGNTLKHSKHDIDGLALFQAPQDILYLNDKVYIADTYNNKIKVLFFDKHFNDYQIKTLKIKFKDGSSLSEPSGLAYASGYLFIVDSNNHRIVKINILNKDQVAYQGELFFS